MGPAPRAGGRPGDRQLSDILAGQSADPSVLAELYDLEHDEITGDLGFYRELTRRHAGRVIDLGCGSARLFSTFLKGGATEIVGVDGSPALLARADARIESDPDLRAARADGRIELVLADVRHARRRQRFALAVLSGVIGHLEGPEEAVQALSTARRLLEPDGVVVIDTLGPGGLPPHDLPLSVDWERSVDGRTIVRRSQLVRRDAPEGLRVNYSTLTDLAEADGTISRLPASFRLWYPSSVALVVLAAEAELEVEAVFGSYDLDPLVADSERCIVVARSAASDSGER